MIKNGAYDDDYIERYRMDEYCLQEKSNEFNDWRLLACRRDLTVHKAFHFTSNWNIFHKLITQNFIFSAYHFNFNYQFHNNCLCILFWTSWYQWKILNCFFDYNDNSLFFCAHHEIRKTKNEESWITCNACNGINRNDVSNGIFINMVYNYMLSLLLEVEVRLKRNEILHKIKFLSLQKFQGQCQWTRSSCVLLQNHCNFN